MWKAAKDCRLVAMALQSVIMENGHPVQRKFNKRRKQLHAVMLWLKDAVEGEEELSLGDYCKKCGTNSAGIQKLMAEEKVQAKIIQVMDSTALVGGALSNNELVRRLKDSKKIGHMTVADLIAIDKHLIKRRAKAYEKEGQVTGGGVAIQISLPDVQGYSKEQRQKPIDVAHKELGDAL